MTYLICLALALSTIVISLDLTPFFALPISDPRLAKEVVALSFALGIFLWGSRKHGIKPKNPWLSVLIGYLSIHYFLSPHFYLPVLGTNIAGIWIFVPMAYALIYYLYYLTIANTKLINLRTIANTLMGLGAFTALYIMFQKYGLDQWQDVVILPGTTPDNPELTGTLTNNTLAAPIMALCVPFAIWRRNWIAVALMIGSIILCNSDGGFIMLAVVLVSYGASKLKHPIRDLIIGLSICGVLGGIFLYKNPDRGSGRFQEWQHIYTETVAPSLQPGKTFAFTGNGNGSYQYIYVAQNKTIFTKAHNEYLEFFYNTGAIGVGLLLLSIFWLIKNYYYFILRKEVNAVLFAVFCGMLAGASVGFIWQVEPLRFLMVTVCGLMQNSINLKEVGHV